MRIRLTVPARVRKGSEGRLQRQDSGRNLVISCSFDVLSFRFHDDRLWKHDPPYTLGQGCHGYVRSHRHPTLRSLFPQHGQGLSLEFPVALPLVLRVYRTEEVWSEDNCPVRSLSLGYFRLHPRRGHHVWRVGTMGLFRQRLLLRYFLV